MMNTSRLRLHSITTSLCLVLCLLLATTKILAQEQITISGYIDDSTSKETLIGATIFCPETKTGTYTNNYGFYSLSLPSNAKTIKISYIGYKPLNFELSELNLEKSQDFHLEPLGELKEVVVIGEKNELSTPNVGALQVPVSIIKTAPSLLGESDLMKTLQLLPGVQSGSDGSSGIYVRGGGPDENLILLDGVSLYNVDHLAGFFSVFTPEAVKDVKLYKGNFPARFGGRLSSVIDVRTNDGNLKEYHGTVSIGAIASKLHVEGPIIKDKTSFNLSLRRTYADLLIRPFLPKATKEQGDAGYYFYDANLKIQHRLGNNDRLFLNLYHGRDELFVKMNEKRTDSEEKNKLYLNWGNTLASLRWNHIINPKLYSNLTTAYTYYAFRFGTEAEYIEFKDNKKSSLNAEYNSGIHDYSINWDLNYYFSNKQKFTFGANYIFHNFRPEAIVTDIDTPTKEEMEQYLNQVKLKTNSKIFAHNLSLYTESKTQFNKYLSLNAGLRLSSFIVDKKFYFSAEPRLLFEYKPIKGLQLQTSYSRMSQNVHLLTSVNMTLPSDLWVPTTKNIKPMNAQQISLGVIYNGINGWEFSIDSYYKDMRNVLEYKDSATFLGSSAGWEDKVVAGRGRTYGVEFLIMKTTGDLTGWLGYTLAKSERKFNAESINYGKWFPYKYDRRHHLNFVLSYKPLLFGVLLFHRSNLDCPVHLQSILKIQPVFLLILLENCFLF